MSIFDKVELERLLTNLYSGAVNSSRLPVDLYKATFDTLLNAVYKGFGNSLSELSDGSPEMDLLKHYEYNIAIFSGAKTFQQVKDMSSLVFTENGYKRDFSEFKRMITGDQFHEGIFAKYNKNYLKTEYNTAVSTAQMGREWLQIEDDADVFPYLKYITAHDERVRHTHQELDGVIRPVGDSFWDSHVPPNGFNCRCRLMQLNPDDDVFSVTPDDTIKNLPKPDSPLFEMNPAKSGYIFDPSIHPYTKNIDERFKVNAEQNFGFPTPTKPTPLKPSKKIEVPEAKINSIANKIEKIKTTKQGKEIVEQIFADNIDRKVKKTIVSGKLSVPDMKVRLSELDRLTSKYSPIFDETIRDINTFKFASTERSYGFVTTSRYTLPDSDGFTRLFIDTFNAGHQTDYFSRIFKENSLFLRGKSRVDSEFLEIATTTHEFAHFLGTSTLAYANSRTAKRLRPFFDELYTINTEYNRKLKKMYDDAKEINKVGSFEALTDIQKARISEIQTEYLGKYANKNIDEFFAESFTEYELSSNPSPTAQKVGKLIEKYFKK